MRLRLIVLLLISSFSISVMGATGLPEKIQSFRQSFDPSLAVAIYPIKQIQKDYPPSLLLQESLLPQTGEYPLKSLRQLYTYSQTCKSKLPLSPLMTEPLSFARALCANRKLPIQWFVNSELIHPGGGTYAARYIQHFPEDYDQVTQFMHIRERTRALPNTLLGRLQNMPYDAIEALVSSSWSIMSGHEIWIKSEQNYMVYPESVWLQHAKDNGLKAQASSTISYCYMRTGNICWSVKSDSNILKYSLIALVAFNILVLISWGYSRWKNKRIELQQRMLVLQILTHELRTPIASLSLTVEGFRREFEHLPESVYDEFRRLCEDTRRLRMLADASKDYLQSDSNPISTHWVTSVAEWLEYSFEEYQDKVEVKLNKDAQIKVNTYWLGTCIENLIKNACKYGVAPVVLQVTILEKKVIFEVIDQGQLTSKDWQQIRKAFVTKSGLGLGLTIVEAMVERMGGKISLSGPPTTFKMEIPCETNNLTG